MSDGMGTYVEFLRARFDEEERYAKKCAELYPAPWHVTDRGHTACVKSDEPNYWDVTELEQRDFINGWLGDYLEHIARQDPDQTLRRIEALRKIVAMYAEALHLVMVAEENGFPELPEYLDRRDAIEPAVLALASIYSDHPDYPKERP